MRCVNGLLGFQKPLRLRVCACIACEMPVFFVRCYRIGENVHNDGWVARLMEIPGLGAFFVANTHGYRHVLNERVLRSFLVEQEWGDVGRNWCRMSASEPTHSVFILRSQSTYSHKKILLLHSMYYSLTPYIVSRWFLAGHGRWHQVSTQSGVLIVLQANQMRSTLPDGA